MRKFVLIILALNFSGYVYGQKAKNYKKELAPELVAGIAKGAGEDQICNVSNTLFNDLKRYLVENTDNSNAFMFMGFIYQARYNAADVLKDTDRLKIMGDSSNYFLELSIKNLDDKELSRYEDFFQSFARRDQRTGKFGISLEDVRYRLEKQVRDNRERLQKVQRMKRYFVQAQTVYESNVQFFKEITGAYENLNQFLLRADEDVVANLEKLKSRQDSLYYSLNMYKSIKTQIGHVPYNQVLKAQEIKDIRQDGQGGADFYQDDLRLWDFSQFSTDCIDAIKNEILPINESLVASDIKLGELMSKIRQDSVSVMGELQALSKTIFNADLYKYDEDPLPYALFRIKMAELQYGSEQALGREDKLTDNLMLRFNRLSNELRAIRVMDSVASKELNRDLESEVLDFRVFIKDTYREGSMVAASMRTYREFAARELSRLEQQVSALKEELKYIRDGKKLVPAQAGIESEGFVPLVFNDETYTAGVRYDSLLHPFGYFYQITGNRKVSQGGGQGVGIKVDFPLDKAIFAVSKKSFFKGFAVAGQGNSIFFPVIISQEKVNGKVPVMVAKIYASDGLVVWSPLLMLDGLPLAVDFIKETGELSITIDTANGPSAVVVSKDGKVIGK